MKFIEVGYKCCKGKSPLSQRRYAPLTALPRESQGSKANANLLGSPWGELLEQPGRSTGVAKAERGLCKLSSPQRCSLRSHSIAQTTQKTGLPAQSRQFLAY